MLFKRSGPFYPSVHFAIVDDLLFFAVVLSDQVMIQVPEDYVESGCVQVGIRNCVESFICSH